jgi:hemoglobin
MRSPGELTDIEDRADVERLVRAFYGRALADPMIGYLFTDVAHLDLEAHVPQITAFWETILLGAQTYRGGAFLALNAQSPLRAGHFERWLLLWTTTVDELFAGPRAEVAKAHALRVAGAFHRRLQGLPDDAPATASAPLSITVTRHGAG